MSERALGFENYTPSRLEWLALMLNSHMSYVDATLVKNADINRIYIPKHDGKTLKLIVSHPKDISSELLENIINEMVKYTEGIAKVYKWDSWIDIEVERHSE